MYSYPPINDCSLLSDHRTIAIVEPNCSISWMCLPRVDSAAVFSHILDTENPPTKAGVFSISDEENSLPIQRYIGDTMVLRSDFPTFHVTDYLDASRGRTKHQAGRSDLIRVIEGSGIVNVVFAPRLNFGRTVTRMIQKDRGLVIKGGNDLLCLRSPELHWSIQEDHGHDTATVQFDLDALGGRVKLEMRCGTANVRSDSMSEPERRIQTQAHWQKWVDKLKIPQVRTEELKRSALALKALCHTPTGAIAAAATMSLPESIGNERNWDYRYCWLRDAAMTASTLVRLGSHAEAMKFLDWLDNIVENLEDLQMLNPLYMISGGHLSPEGEISELSGYRGSKPVRINNGADNQVQLDVLGNVVDLVYVLAQHGEPLATKHWNLIQNLVKIVESRWKEEDAGIWEKRSEPRQYTHSKVMCWVAVDRAIYLADYFTGEVPKEWEVLRDEISQAIRENCYNEELGAYTAAYDGTDTDAALLALGLYNFIPMTDPKFIGTLEQIEKHLLVDDVVFRYFGEDGLTGKEGGFILLTFWLAQCYYESGRQEDAVRLFNITRKYIGKTGLMSEQWDPEHGEALGNHPQAYSHLGYIEAAISMYQDDSDRVS